MKSHHAWPVIVLAGLATWGTGCAHTETTSLATPQPSRSPPFPDVAITTTTTGKATHANRDLSLSDELLAACKLRFDDASQAPKFDFATSALDDQERSLLQQVATCVTTGPLKGRGLRLVGRADPRGEGEYNMVLGEHRASSVSRYLSQLGVASSKLTETSRGKLDATGTDDATWQRDRRVDIDLRP
jgi:peptidoglycan-associated lipoprotein